MIRLCAKAFSIGIIVFAMVSVRAFSADAGEVIVVKNVDLKPYQDALRGFKEACGCETREIKLRDDEGVEKVLQNAPDAVVAIGTSAFKKLKTIDHLPVIYTMVMPTETNRALSRNMTGVSMDLSPEVCLSALRDVFPQAKRIGLIYDPRHTSVFVEEVKKAAHAEGIELVTRQTREPSEVPGLLDSFEDTMDVFWMLPDPTVATSESIDYLFRFSFQRNIPVFSFSKKYVEMGAVAALALDPYDMGVQAGELYKGLVPGNASAVRVYARKGHLILNKRVAEKMGLNISVTTRRVDLIE